MQRLTAQRPLRVLLVEGHDATRRWAERQLAAHGGVALVAHAAGPEDALATANTCRPDVAIVDMLLAQENGFALARHLRDRHPALRVVLTGHETHPGLDTLARRAGAAGFLPLADLTAEALLDVLAPATESCLAVAA